MPPPAPIGIITRKHDRFTNVDSVAMAGFAVPASHIEAPLELSMWSADPRAAVIAFHLAADDWTFLKCHRVDMLVDGRRLNHSEPKHTGDVMRRGVLESVIVIVDRDGMAELAGADEIEGRICNSEFELTAEQRDAIRRFVSEVFWSPPDASAQ